MPDFTIQSFKFGLDTRKDVLTSQPGTLQTCENGHINSGGEIEKRKAFALHANASILDSLGNIGAFGLEAVDVGLMIFGSAAETGPEVQQGEPFLASAVPGLLTYQQLRHPTLLNDSAETYADARHRMTATTYSENFRGKAFVIATFSDGRTFAYYDGELIQQSANGLVMTDRLTLADIAEDLARQLDDIGWTGLANVDELGAALNGSVLMRSPPGDYFSVVATDTAANGSIGVKLISSDAAVPRTAAIHRETTTATVTLADHGFSVTDRVTITESPDAAFNISSAITNVTKDTFDYTVSGAVSSDVIAKVALDLSGVRATAAFKIDINTGTFQLSAPTASDGTGSVNLHDTAITALGTATLTAAAIVQGVNDLSYVHGYNALASADSVYVYAPAAWGNFTFNLTVDHSTAVAVVAAGAPPSTLSIQVEPAAISVSGPSSTLGGEVEISVAGGTPPYICQWSELEEGSGNGINIDYPQSFATGFNKSNLIVGQTVIGQFKCEIEDDAGAPATAIVYYTVTLRRT